MRISNLFEGTAGIEPAKSHRGLFEAKAVAAFEGVLCGSADGGIEGALRQQELEPFVEESGVLLDEFTVDARDTEVAGKPYGAWVLDQVCGDCEQLGDHCAVLENTHGALSKPCEQPGLALLDKAMQLSEAVEGGELARAGYQIVERAECDEVRDSQ
jgi:hypothetical protein